MGKECFMAVLFQILMWIGSNLFALSDFESVRRDRFLQKRTFPRWWLVNQAWEIEKDSSAI